MLVSQICLGIGADDVFIFVDAWKQALIEPHLETPEKQMSWAYYRAAKAMLATSVTTAVAFLGNVLSPIPPYVQHKNIKNDFLRPKLYQKSLFCIKNTPKLLF